MHLRNGEHGYGVVTRTLHWATVLLVLAQLVVGWTMDPDDSGHGRGRGRGGDSGGDSGGRGRGRGRGGDRDDGYDVLDGSFDLLDLHVLLGLTLLALAVVRTLWRLTTPLPPWSPTLTAGGRRWLHASEVGLLTSLYAMPLTGLVLVVAGDDDVVPLHVAAHVLFYVALAAHLGIVVRARLLPRMLGRAVVTRHE
ncbi:cytochrome b/b6 domain-containing protein [Nocardioides sp. SYSU D00038]|uniref:cytochrome b/b6 domain-containing protein n=1 Tax=Nocardioides sp. SYSU D00038 TaxID=2812554 RepID=UPI001967A51C|nr:cytochrome b/b6 domain-containing protein [Nocardioides sp. SYSU D00038]